MKRQLLFRIFSVLLYFAVNSSTVASQSIQDGIDLLNSGSYKQAADLFSLRIFSDSLDYKAWYYRGLANYNLNRFNKAVLDFTQTISIIPAYNAAYRNRGATYFNLSKYQLALEDYTKAIEIDSTDADAFYRRGHLLKNGFSQTEKALDDYSRAITLDSNKTWAYVNRGNIYIEQEQYKNAVADFTIALKQNNKMSQTYFSRGTAYLKLQNYALAISDFDKTISLNKPFYLAYYYKALCLELSGEQEKAVSVYKELLLYLPDSEKELKENALNKIK